jgi:ligand-binding sensor domain-containing protein/signal transduction histidine kinase
MRSLRWLLLEGIVLAAGIILCRGEVATCRTNSYEEARLTSTYRVRSWSTEDGLPQNTVLCVLQSSDGYLWFGTLDGLVRYDGLRFTVYDAHNVPALNEQAVSCLAEHPAGCLWVGTTAGLLQYSNHCFRSIEVGAARVGMRAVCPRREGGLWLGTALGLARLDGGHAAFDTNYPSFVALSGAPGARGINSLAESADGTLWAGDDRGVVRLVPGAARPEVVFAADGNLGSRSGGAGKIVCDKQGAVWFGNDAGLYCWREGRLVLYPSRPNGLEGRIDPLAWDNKSGLWISNGRGRLSRLQNDRFVHYSAQSDLLGGEIRCLGFDREGNRWLGTQFGGLSLLQRRKVHCLTVEQGLASDDVWSICEAPDHSVWLGTADGLSRYADGQVITNRLARGSGQYQNTFHAVLAGRSGEVWAGSTAGLSVMRGGRIEPVIADLGVKTPMPGIESLYLDADGTLWVGAGNLFWFRERRWGLWGFQNANLGAQRALPNPSVIGILRDARGDLWVGTKGGVCRIRGESAESFTLTNGFPAEIASPALADRDGTVWFASSKGLVRYREGRFFLISHEHGLLEDLVYNVLEDDLGWLWLNGNRGLQRLRKQAANDVADGRVSSFLCLRYGAAEGMLSAEGNGFCTPNSCKTSDGRLWFPTVKGAVIVDPLRLESNQAPPLVLIEEVVADGKVVFGEDAAKPGNSKTEYGTNDWSSADELRLDPGRARSLLIHYTAPSFVAPERMRFEYQLEGQDSAWQSDSRNLRTAIYTGLRPGHYRFRLRAFDAQGLCSAREAQVAFSLAPFFYQTWPFYCLCGGVIVALAGSAHFVRMRGLHRIKELEQQHALDLERTRLARDMHDSLAADLTRIVVLADTAQRAPLASLVQAAQWEKVASVARGLVDGIGELVWATNPRNNNLDSLAAYLRAYASEVTDAVGLSCHFDFPGQIPPVPVSGEARRHVFLALKEALNNVVKHARARHVNLALKVSEQSIAISLHDDGCGFEPSNMASAGPGTGGNGLRHLRERMAALGAACVVESAPGQGTRVVLTFPVPPTPEHSTTA